jgi:hypothetical protein
MQFNLGLGDAIKNAFGFGNAVLPIKTEPDVDWNSVIER